MSKYSLSALREKGLNIYQGFVRAVFVMMIVVGLYNVILDFGVSHLIFDEFTVPVSLEEKGYTGKEIARRISDKVNSIRDNVKSHVKIYKVMQEDTGGEEEIPDFEVPGAGLSLQTVIGYLRSFFGISEQRIYGSVVETNKLYMTVRISGQPSIMFVAKKNNMEDLIEKAAAHVLMQLEPFSIALYYKENNSIKELQKMVKLLKEKDNSDDVKITIHIINSFILTSQKKYKASAKEAKLAVDINPEHPYALHNYSLALIDVDKLPESIDVMKKLTNVYSDWSTYNNMAYVLMMMGKYEKAIVAVKKSIKLRTDCDQCYDTWASILMKQGEYKLAFSKVEQALEYAPSKEVPYFLYFMGNIYLAEGKKEKAMKKYLQVIADNEDSSYGKKSQQKIDELNKVLAEDK